MNDTDLALASFGLIDQVEHIIASAPVPLPGSLLLVAAGIGAALVRRRRLA